MCSAVANGNHRPPKGKYDNNSNIEIVTFSGKDSLQLMRALHAGKSVLGLNSSHDTILFCDNMFLAKNLGGWLYFWGKWNWTLNLTLI